MYTKGKWVCIIDETENEHPILSTDANKNIACVNAKSHYGNCDKEEAEANAKLLTAAPLLLDALQKIVEYEDRGRAKGEPRISETWYELAIKAINEAI